MTYKRALHDWFWHGNRWRNLSDQRIPLIHNLQQTNWKAFLRYFWIGFSNLGDKRSHAFFKSFGQRVSVRHYDKTMVLFKINKTYNIHSIYMYSDFTQFMDITNLVLMFLYPPSGNTDTNNNNSTLKYRSTVNFTFEYTLSSTSF